MQKVLRALVHNLDLKIGALVLAAVTWYYLATAGLEERRYSRVAVRVVGLPPNSALLLQETRDVSVTLKGPRGQLDALEGSDLVAEIDLRKVPVKGTAPVKSSVSLGAGNIREAVGGGRSKPLRPEVSFVRADPRDAIATISSLHAKALKVKLSRTGNPPPGFVLDDSVEPSTVTVRGPWDVLRALSRIETETVSIEGLRKGHRVERNVALQTKIKTATYGTVDVVPAKRTVTVSLSLTEKIGEKGFPRVRVGRPTAPKGFQLIHRSVAEVTLTLRGPQRLLDGELDERRLRVWVDLESTRPEPGRQLLHRVRVGKEHIQRLLPDGEWDPLPPDVELGEIGAQDPTGSTPDEIVFTLDPLDKRQLPVQPDFKGKPPEGYEVDYHSVVPETVEVWGPQSILRGLKAIKTAPVWLSGLRERLPSIRVRLVTTLEDKTYGPVPIQTDPDFVHVTVSVLERRLRKTLKGLPIRLLVAPEVAANAPVEITPAKLASVAFEGPSSVMKDFDESSIVAYVHVKAAHVTPGRPVDLPVEFRTSDPRVRLAPGQKLDVTLNFPPSDPTERKTLTGLPVSILLEPGVRPDLRVELDISKLAAVIFEGAASRMADFGPDSVVAFVRVTAADLTEKRPTPRTVEFHFRSPNVHLAPDQKPIPVTLKFPPPKPEASPDAAGKPPAGDTKPKEPKPEKTPRDSRAPPTPAPEVATPRK